jgi:hypothetical protein
MFIVFIVLLLLIYCAWLLEPFRLNVCRAAHLRDKISGLSDERLIRKYRAIQKRHRAHWLWPNDDVVRCMLLEEFSMRGISVQSL